MPMNVLVVCEIEQLCTSDVEAEDGLEGENESRKERPRNGADDRIEEGGEVRLPSPCLQRQKHLQVLSSSARDVIFGDRHLEVAQVREENVVDVLRSEEVEGAGNQSAALRYQRHLHEELVLRAVD